MGKAKQGPHRQPLGAAAPMHPGLGAAAAPGSLLACSAELLARQAQHQSTRRCLAPSWEAGATEEPWHDRRVWSCQGLEAAELLNLTLSPASHSRREGESSAAARHSQRLAPCCCAWAEPCPGTSRVRGISVTGNCGGYRPACPRCAMGTIQDGTMGTPLSTARVPQCSGAEGRSRSMTRAARLRPRLCPGKGAGTGAVEERAVTGAMTGGSEAAADGSLCGTEECLCWLMSL